MCYGGGGGRGRGRRGGGGMKAMENPEYPDEVILDNSAGEATDIRRGKDKGGTNTSPIKCEQDTATAMALCL